MNNYRVERILGVNKDEAGEGYVVKAFVQGMHGYTEEPSERGEIEISIGSLDENELRFYRIKGKKKEKIRIDKPSRFIYVVKGWLKKIVETV